MRNIYYRKDCDDFNSFYMMTGQRKIRYIDHPSSAHFDGRMVKEVDEKKSDKREKDSLPEEMRSAVMCGLRGIPPLRLVTSLVETRHGVFNLKLTSKQRKPSQHFGAQNVMD
ncbi:hypothetical protein EVAR_92198_1 [Eumeta japonica]|uniref:Uncharacterized protein n=1 Tax=Eumeta variegata TaxID=151549 RepID=A0A4C1TN57_EUMVA|nr:hypothetical protein EVAR_92198_1 [Eumeta japonica]